MTSISVLIEPATADVLDEVLAIEQACFSAPWTRKMLAAELSGNQFANFLIAKCPDPLSGSLAVAGYFCFWVVFEEVRLMNLAVLAPFRRRGVATALMTTCLAWCRQRRVVRIDLHASSAGARVYERLGFVPREGEMRWDAAAAATLGVRV